MHVTLVHVYVKPAHIDDFIAAIKLNHEGSIKEPGNLRFDVLQDPEDPAHFLIYEGFASADDVSQHKNTVHYLAWRDAVADWMDKPRQGVRYHCLFPQE